MLSDFKIIAALFLEQAGDLWPFYLGGVFFAAFIKTFKWDRRIRASLVRYGRSAVVVATAAGLISPLCSCGILPVVIALSAAGVPLAPVLALLITSPLMSPDAFLITVGQLGWTYALWKMAAATVVGLAAGFGARAGKCVRGSRRSLPRAALPTRGNRAAPPSLLLRKARRRRRSYGGCSAIGRA
jgi:uncharacterized membrane protein YraQ (UPF0718 family)